MIKVTQTNATDDNHVAQNKIKPLHQFEVHKIFDINIAGHDISFTNSAFAMVSVVAVFVLFYCCGYARRRLYDNIPNKIQSLMEIAYTFIHDTVTSVAGGAVKMIYVKFIFALFLFVLLLNIVGLLPYGFAPTAHIIITFALAVVVFIVTLLISIFKHGIFFFKIFIPHGTPMWMAPLMFILEVFSYLAKPISLSIRLAANMIAGHVMLEIVAFFVLMMGLYGIFPMIFLMAMIFFEICVAALQAYIFALLASIYIGEALQH